VLVGRQSDDNHGFVSELTHTQSIFVKNSQKTRVEFIYCNCEKQVRRKSCAVNTLPKNKVWKTELAKKLQTKLFGR